MARSIPLLSLCHHLLLPHLQRVLLLGKSLLLQLRLHLLMLSEESGLMGMSMLGVHSMQYIVDWLWRWWRALTLRLLCLCRTS